MAKDLLDGRDFQGMMQMAADMLRECKETVNTLNVFPVPDGDTGTNMYLTLTSAVAEIRKTPQTTLGDVIQSAAMGSLMGARGNSGVILSQIFRGMAKSLRNKHEATSVELGRALDEGARTAYKAVMKPVEGTILTVAKEAARSAIEAARSGGDILTVWRSARDGAAVALDSTPDLLPVLKQAGVVDAGGKGLLYILSAGLDSLMGKSVTFRDDSERAEFHAVDAETSLEYPYDVQLLVHSSSLGLTTALRETLSGLGDSLLVVGEGEVARVHLHTAKPGKVLDVCLDFGDISDVEIENMRRQYQEVSGQLGSVSTSPLQSEEARGICVVAVAVGEGMIEVFKSLGAQRVIDGGQTMNPSTEQVVEAVEQCPSQEVIVLPNNPNVILGAEQAQKLAGKRVHVLPTRNLPQGMAALLALREDRDVETNLVHMEKAFLAIKTGEITYSVRNMKTDALTVNVGDVLGISQGKILSVGSVPEEVLIDLISRLVSSGDELISVFYGMRIKPDVAEAVGERLSGVFPEFEVEVRYGGQPLHYYVFSIE